MHPYAAQTYLNLAFGRPGPFRLMCASGMGGAADAPASLLIPAGEAWESLFRAVAAAHPGADLATAKRRFMTEPLTEAEPLAAILDKTLNAA